MPTSATTSTPLWREFEKLVARIEQTLAGSDVVVKSPDRITSLITSRKREVDASMRARIGSVEVLVTIECRKRRAKQDVTWIEQLASKKAAIGASRTIAVSSTLFSSDAVQAAGYYGIDLRVLSQITDADMRSWMLPSFVTHLYKSCELLEPPHVAFKLNDGDVFPDGTIVTGGGHVDAPDFSASNGSRLTLNDIWLRVDDQMKIFDSIPVDDKVYVRHIAVKASDDLYLQTILGPRRIQEIKLKMALRWKHESISIGAANVVKYSPASPSTGQPILIRAEFESKEAPHMNLRLGFQVEPGSTDVIFSIETLPPKRDA